MNNFVKMQQNWSNTLYTFCARKAATFMSGENNLQF